MIDLGILFELNYLILGCVAFVFVLGLLCFFIHRHPVRQLVGLKLMLQSVSLGLIYTGWQNQDLRLAQSMIISALVIEAVVVGLALTMIIHLTKHAEDGKRVKPTFEEQSEF